MTTRGNSLNPKYNKVKEEDNKEIIMIKIIMIRLITKVGID